jgi:hypothetical protein
MACSTRSASLRAQPPEERQRRLQPLACRLWPALLGVHQAVHVQQAGLGVGIGHAPRQREALVKGLLCLGPLPLNALLTPSLTCSQPTRAMLDARAA